MKSLFEKDATAEVLQRIDQLKLDSQRVWGKMDVAQMLAHCSATMKTATGELKLPRMFLGKILGGFFRRNFSDEKPFSKNGPTDKNFIMTDKRVFEVEKQQLKQIIQQFHEGGESKCTTHPHSFFGQITTEEWGKGMYKHLDHHLTQFGV